jgi:TonB-dependent SusC/RagA subfamily outer membrane receptor
LTKDSVARALTAAAAARRARGHYVGGPEDTVAVGYGSTSRRRLTGSVSSVSGDEGHASRVLRVEELLYRVPGVRVVPRSDGTYSITIRGKATLGYGSTDPLFVFDGLPVEDGISVLRGMSPEDVDRIDVIKDADASIYGSRSANGVILVRTRHAKVPRD